jgi:hypothetical protein
VSHQLNSGPLGIIITDLDSFTQSDDEEERDLAVNTALLEKIRANVVDESPNPLLPTTSRALVLFRPLPWASAVNEEAKREELKKAHKANKVHSRMGMDVKLEEDDMAMEVEI